MKTRVLSLFISVCAVLLLLPAGSENAHAATGVTIQTTLTDHATLKGSKKTFDVLARDSAGKKVASSVKLNGTKVPVTWDDCDKTSYTLIFTRVGANQVEITAGSASRTYTLNYQKAKKGETIGSAVFDIELFTIGGDYLVPPTTIKIIEGENSAHALIRLLHQHGYQGFYSGTPDKAFYLAYVADGICSGKTYQGYTSAGNSYGTITSAQKLPGLYAIPKVLSPLLEENMSYYDPDDAANWSGYLGEFVFSNGSGWMYSVNNVFPNVGFADTYLSDGDVVRVQFTLAYGADIGGSSAMGGAIPGAGDFHSDNFYSSANKCQATLLMARAREPDLWSRSGVSAAYNACKQEVTVVNASQAQVNAAADKLAAVLSRYTSAALPTAPTAQVTKPMANRTGNSSQSAGWQTTRAASGGTRFTTAGGSTSGSLSDFGAASNAKASASDKQDSEKASSSSASPKSKTSHHGSNLWLIIVCVVIVAAGSGAAAYHFLYKKHQSGEKS